jgi:hypothetical protein
VDDAIEKMLLELAQLAFSLLRMARIGVRSAGIVYSRKA